MLVAGFEESGQLVRMILGIVNGIAVFLVILAVCVLGFAFSFFLLYQDGSGTFSSAGAGGQDVEDEPYGMTDPGEACRESANMRSSRSISNSSFHALQLQPPSLASSCCLEISTLTNSQVREKRRGVVLRSGDLHNGLVSKRR